MGQLSHKLVATTVSTQQLSKGSQAQSQENNWLRREKMPEEEDGSLRTSRRITLFANTCAQWWPVLLPNLSLTPFLPFLLLKFQSNCLLICRSLNSRFFFFLLWMRFSISLYPFEEESDNRLSRMGACDYWLILTLCWKSSLICRSRVTIRGQWLTKFMSLAGMGVEVSFARLPSPPTPNR